MPLLSAPPCRRAHSPEPRGPNLASPRPPRLSAWTQTLALGLTLAALSARAATPEALAPPPLTGKPRGRKSKAADAPRKDPPRNGLQDPLQDPLAEPLRLHPPKYRARAAAELGLYLVADWSLLLVTPPPVADPPGNVSVWTKLSGKGITFDASSYPMNFLFHPLAGRLYYGVARSNGMSSWESLGWAFAASSLWELAEFPENFSINDDIMTPVGGASLGESLFQLASWIDAQHYGFLGTVVSTVIAPPLRLNAELDHAQLGPGASGVMVAHTGIRPGMIKSGGKWSPGMGLELNTRLVQDRAYQQPGRGTRLHTDGGATELSFQTTGGPHGVADLQISARTWMATVYDRNLVRTPNGALQGFDLLAGVGPGYEYRIHDWDLQRAGPLDTFSLVHVPGVFAEVRRFDGPVRLTARADAALSFGGTRSVVLDADPRALPLATLPTPTRAYGYYFGWGPSVAASLGLGVGPATLTGTARLDSLKGIDSRDVWPGRHPTADLGDRWAELSARLAYQLPWNGLEVSATAERSLRSGHAGDTSHTVGQTTFFLGIGFNGP